MWQPRGCHIIPSISPIVHPLNAIACMLNSIDVTLGWVPDWLVSGAGVGRAPHHFALTKRDAAFAMKGSKLHS